MADSMMDSFVLCNEFKSLRGSVCSYRLSEFFFGLVRKVIC